MLHYAAEFEATAENGIIHLPAGYPELANAQLRVLVLSAKPTQEQAEAAALAQRQAKRERLIAAFERLRELNPYRAITDPVQWQRDLRDEWERPLSGRS